MNLSILNKHCLYMANRYRNISIFGEKVGTPYYINEPEMYFLRLAKKVGVSEKEIKKIHMLFKERAVPYGWYLGKGTPDQIQKSTITIAEQLDTDLRSAEKEQIIEYMKLFGIGVDCSGFVYNVLAYAFDKVGKQEVLDRSLDWSDKKTGVTRAGSFVFSGKSSKKINPEVVRPLDLIITTVEKGAVHPVLILSDEKDGLLSAQSTIRTVPTGVCLDKLEIKNGKPKFHFKPSIGIAWEKLYEEGMLEFRRLDFEN